MFLAALKTLLNPVALLAIVLAAGIGAVTGYHYGAKHATAKERAACMASHQALQKAAETQKTIDAAVAHSASTEYQKEQSHAETVYRTIYRDVERVVAGPCLDDDGLQLAQRAIAAANARVSSAAASR